MSDYNSNVARTVAQWLQIFSKIDGDQNSKNFPAAPLDIRIADRIVSDLFGYAHGNAMRPGRYRLDDAISIANAFAALGHAVHQADIELTKIVNDICEVVPQNLPLIHAPNCASHKIVEAYRTSLTAPGPLDIEETYYGAMGKCDCQMIQVDLTEEAKARLYDRVREILYRKDR